MNELVKIAFIETTMRELGATLAKSKISNMEKLAFDWRKFRLVVMNKLANLEMAAPVAAPLAQAAGAVPKAKFNWKGFREGAMADLGPATGSVIGAGLASAYGINPVAGAAAGYGVGAIPEIIHGIRFRGIPH